MADLEDSTCELIMELGAAEERITIYEEVIKKAEDLVIKGLREDDPIAKDAYLHQIARVLSIITES